MVHGSNCRCCLTALGYNDTDPGLPGQRTRRALGSQSYPIESRRTLDRSAQRQWLKREPKRHLVRPNGYSPTTGNSTYRDDPSTVSLRKPKILSSHGDGESAESSTEMPPSQNQCPGRLGGSFLHNSRPDQAVSEDSGADLEGRRTVATFLPSMELDNSPAKSTEQGLIDTLPRPGSSGSTTLVPTNTSPASTTCQNSVRTDLSDGKSILA